MNDKLVTLIGGNGFIGRYVYQLVLQQERNVRVRVATREPKRAWFLKPLAGLGQSQVVAADVTRPDSIARAIEGSDAVVNLVGVLKGPLQAVHVDGARAVAEASARAGVKALVHLSALGADPQSPSVYGRTKALGEEAVRAAYPNATILRPSVVFGREDNFINRLAGMVSRLPVVPVLRGGARLQPVYATDVAEAVVAAVNDPERFGGRTFELGGPEVVTMAEIHQRLARILNRKARFLEVPDGVGSAIASLGFLPGAPITSDQWAMLQRDSVVSEGAEGLEALGVVPTPFGSVAEAWLVRYRRQGRFAKRQPA